MVVTDHSPCPPAMKRLADGNFRTAWGGIASLSVALPLMWTEASSADSRCSISLVGWQRHRLGWPVAIRARAELPPDTTRTFVVFDPDREFVVTEDRLHYRHPVSPYLGETLRGVVKATYLRGNPVFADGEFPASLAGGNEYLNISFFSDPATLLLPIRRSLAYTIPSAGPAFRRVSKDMNSDRIVGNSVPRKEGRDKVTGRSQYVDDMVLPNMLFGATVRSQDSARPNQENHIRSGNFLG
jgi:hypothetical protein